MSAARQAAEARERAALRRAQAEAAAQPDSPAAIAATSAQRRAAEADLTEREQRDLGLEFRRIIDQNIRRNNSYAVASACMTLLLKLIGNVIEQPTEDKFRSFKTQQKLIAAQVLTVPGGTEYLIEAGFRKRVVEMQEHWCLPPSNPSDRSLTGPKLINGISERGWTRLRVAQRALRGRIDEVAEQAERIERNAEAEAEIERNRKARALDEFHEDRKAREARDAIARERRMQAEHEKEAEAREMSASASPSSYSDM